MRMLQKLTLAHRSSKHSPGASPKLIALGLALALLATAFLARRYFAVTAQEQSGEQIQLTRIAADAEGSAGVAHHQPSGSLLLASDGGAELMANDGTRTPFSLIGGSQGKLASARESKNGFIAGETFVSVDGAGAIARISTNGSWAQNPWITLPGEVGQARNLFFDHSGLFNGDLIAVTTSGGVWRIDAAGNAARVTPMITARSDAGEGAPVSFESVTVAPNDPARYGALAGKILAVADPGLVYVIGADGAVESFDLGLRQTNNLIIIPENENFFGGAIERRTTSDGQTANQRTIWGAAAANFARMAGDFLITQGGGETCHCRPTLWRAHWNGSGFEKTKLAEVPGSNEQTEWAQAAFSPFGNDLFARTSQPNQQQTVTLEKSVKDVNGGLVMSGDELIYTLRLNNQSGSPITKSFIAEFIPPNATYTANSVEITYRGQTKSQKDDPNDNDQVDAFTSGGKVVQINIATGEGAGGHIGGGLIGGTLAHNETTTITFRVTVNPGLLHNSLVINGANWGADDQYPAGSSNIVVLPPVTLDKTVFNESNPGAPVLPGQFLRYELTLRNVSLEPVGNTFIAEFIPAGVTYESGSVRINGAARTDVCGDDQVDYFAPTAGNNGQINIATGAGAGPVSSGSCGLTGGTLAPGQIVTVTFRVRVNTGLTTGTIVSNGANAGANGMYPVAASNILTTPVSFALPLLGPFGQPAAVGPTDNNDDFTRLKVNLNTSGAATTETGNVRFINTVRNAGSIPGKFVIRAMGIAPGFAVSISLDSGATFTSLNGGATATTPTDVNPGEERNLDVRIGLPTGLAINTDHPVTLQANWDVDSTKSNRTIDLVRVDPNPPNLTLAKGVRDLNGADLDGKTVPQGQTIEYTLTLRNNSAVSVGNTFIAEYLPPNVTYVANSARIITGPNAGAKTDDPADGDQVAFYPTSPGGPNGQINIFTGAGAINSRGGALAPGESTMIAFRVTVNASALVGTAIRNGADWGAEDFGVGGKSNIVTVTVVDVACTPLLGPFDQPDAGTPPDRNDDLTLLKVNLNVSGGLTTETGVVRFINTLRNVGSAPSRFVISAPTIPPGFTVRISVDSGATFVSLNSGAAATTPTPLNPGESRNLDVRIDLPVGLAPNTNYDIALQAACESDPTRLNRTIDRVRIDPNAPNLTLVKAARDLNGNDISGQTLCAGQTIEYTLTLRNAGATPVGKTFIAEYLPPNVTYVANSARITAGANAGAKTDARGDDQIDYFPNGFVNGQINIFTGMGATADRGGALAPDESATVAFRVTINASAPVGTIIRNGADWSAEDFGIGGKSNVVLVTIGAAQAPIISTQPANQTICVGQSATFSVVATGANLTYQWRKNGVKIAGATSASFTIPSAAAGDAGGYDVVITNVCGSVTSNAATLTVNQATAITTQPANQTVCAGQPATFNVVATGANLTYQWRKNGANIVGATGASFTIASTVAGDAGSYDVVVTGACGAVTSNVATLTVNPATAITAQPVSQTVCAGAPATFTVTATGAGLTYQWRKNGANINGATANSFTIPSAAASDAGSYDVVVTGTCGAITSNATTLTINPATAITTQPANQTVCAGQPAAFSVVAAGANLTYQWRKNGVNIAGATGASFTIASTVAGDAGSYDVVVTGACGAVTSNVATLTVNPATAITAQPVSQTVCAGAPATFTVTATGAGLTYQWRKNGANINGATANSFTIPSAAASDAGSYDVVVTGTCGAITSNATTLTINPATAITTQPANQTVCAGQPAAFSVVAAGANLTYQWRKSGVNIAGATSSSFTIVSTAAGDAGSYDVVVTGACGTVTSAAATLTVNPATAIITQPANQTVCAGQPATFTVVTTGANLTYQWRKNGVNITGATSSSFTIVSTAAGDAGSYDVVVTGTCSAVTSNAATLTVNPATVITTQPVNQTVCAGQPATFTVVAAGANLTYQWRKNDVSIAGATGASFTIASTAAGDAGSYDVVVTGACGTATSNVATLTVNPATAITTQPTNQTVCAGQPATFTVAATGANLTYQWRKSGANIAGATSSSFTIASTAAGDAGSYDVIVTGACGTATSNVATLTINPATAITAQPVSQAVCAGAPATFTATATGAGLTYQWRKNGTNINGATASSFTIPSAAAGDAGSYDVVVTGTCGAVTSNAAMLTINPATAITTQPANQTVCAGQPATFTVAATGANLTYQWRKNGVNIAGATGASFTIASTVAGDAGSYDVVVTGACGTVTSAAATLTVNPAIVITTQPANQTVCAGQPAAFSVVAAGANLTYQWRKNGVNIAGATSSSFTIASTAAGDAGSYDVVVTGTCGMVTSGAATLTVNPATAITTQPANQTVCAGTSATFTVTATGANLTYQWRRNGVNIAGAASSMFTIASVVAGDAAQYDVVVTGACGTVTSAAATLTVNHCPPGGCRITICFRSARYFSLYWGTNNIPNGPVLVDGINLRSPIPSTDPRVKMALDGHFGALVREYVAAQLNILSASGLGASNVVTAMQSSLSCYGLIFNPVAVNNGGVTFTPETKLFDLVVYLNSAVKGGVSSRDACVLVKLLNGLNGDDSANVCHRPTGMIDFTSCN